MFPMYPMGMDVPPASTGYPAFGIRVSFAAAPVHIVRHAGQNSKWEATYEELVKLGVTSSGRLK